MAKRSATRAIAGTLVLAGLGGLVGVTPASAAGATQGVTATTIRVGIPYVDVADVAAVGVHISWGNVPDAYKAVISNINAHGGIDGRKIVPYILGVDPTGTAPAATACTQLTEDDKVFAVIAPLQPTCYLQNGTPVVASVLQSTASASTVAQNFSLTPPATAYDAEQLPVFAKQGDFKGKKVGLFAGVTSDQQELTYVQGFLKKLKVDVVQTAVNSAPQGDLSAENQQTEVIAQKFESAGVDEVVAVGYGSALWPEGLTAIQSSYNPPWVATSYNDLTGDVAGTNGVPYLKDVVTSTPIPSGSTMWSNAGTQSCVKLVRKEYPSDKINAFSASLPGSKATWMGIEQACTDMALFEAIAKAAGKDLTVQSFVHAGYGLRNVVLPGYPSPVSFGPDRPYALGPVYMAHYDVSTKSLIVSSNSST